MSGIRRRQIKRAAEKVLIFVALMALMMVPGSSQTIAGTDATVTPTAIAKKRVVLVSIADRKLALLEDGKVVKVYRVAVGSSISPSPSGEFEIVNRITNPTYYHPHVVIPAGENSPIGTRWVGLNRKGYGIHGTNEPRSIGRAASHGCIRLRNRDVERLYAMLRVGDVVEIRGTRDEQTAELFGGTVDGSTLAEASTSIPVSGQE